MFCRSLTSGLYAVLGMSDWVADFLANVWERLFCLRDDSLDKFS